MTGPTTQQMNAYRALQAAAERIGRNNYRTGRYRPSHRRGKLVRGYAITPEHGALIQAMSDVLSGKITPDQAMALIWDYDTMKQRFPDA